MTATRPAPRSSRPAPYPATQRSRRQRSKSRRSAATTQAQHPPQNITPLTPHSARLHPSIPFQATPQAQSLHPSHPPRSVHGHRRRTRRFYYFSLISEAGLKILINGLLLSACAVALGRLLPQMWQNNQQRLAIETELEVTQQRVNTLEEHFSQTFDPRSSIGLIEQQSYQVDPHKQRIVFTDKVPQEPEQ
jgi:hypothetical protein